jgi:Arc/MetJ-type ribon-helix-helix transcriptional regulator
MTPVSPQNEELLRQLVSTGRFQSEDQALAVALQMLHDHSASETTETKILPPDKWLAEFDRITASRRGGNPHMDDRRESIYGDRGL